MRPILYVLGFGIAFGLAAAVCFPFGLDITGNTAGQTMNNSTHIEALPANTTRATNIDVPTTGDSPNANETPEKEFTSVYSFAFVRSCMYYIAIISIFNSIFTFSFFLDPFLVVCLILWIFHFFNYVDKFNEREAAEEENDAANNTFT